MEIKELMQYSGSIIGGLLIGLSASIFILLNGKIMGVSGIWGGVLNGKLNELNNRLIFIVGLISSYFIYNLFFEKFNFNITVNWFELIISAFLIGWGSRAASGCTSGHALCGLSRFSKRSFYATLIFVSVAMITAFLVNKIKSGGLI